MRFPSVIYQVKTTARQFFIMQCALLFLSISCSPLRNASDDADINIVKFRTIGSIPVVEAMLNGKRAIFIVDTGASVSVINESEAKHFDFKIRHNNPEYAVKEVIGFGGSATLKIAFNCSIELGSRKINSTVFNSSDMRNLAAIICKAEALPFAGILGADVLYRYRMNIDFGSRTITSQ